MNRQHVWLLVLGFCVSAADADTHTHFSSRIDGLLLPAGR